MSYSSESGVAARRAGGNVFDVSQTSDELAARLLDSYAETGVINHIEGVNLPSKQAVAEITSSLLRLLLPGFYQSEPMNEQSCGEYTRRRLEEVHKALSTEAAKSLEFAPLTAANGGGSCEEALRITTEFLGRLPAVREVLVTDVEAAYDGDPAAATYEEIILAYPGIEAVAVQRLAHELYRAGVALIPRMMTEWAHSRTGIDIHPGAEIGPYFFIDHGTGVVIGETCRIGSRVKVYHGVTLGARSTSGGQELRGAKRHPTIEDGVTIYPGATILGWETVIGVGSTIGGNVFLLHGVPPKSLVYYQEGAVLVKNKGAADFSGSLPDNFTYVI